MLSSVGKGLFHTGQGRQALLAQTTRSVSKPSDFERLATVRLPLIILVVLFHNESGGHFIERLSHAPMMAALVDWIANGMGSIRVPAFFLIAGYVFFRNAKPTLSWFRQKLKARASSLLLPLLLWTALWLVVVGVAQQLPFLRSFFNGNTLWSNPVLEMSAQGVLTAFCGQPWEVFVYPLWFLRDLFVLAVLAPFFYGLITVSRGWITAVALAAWYLGFHNHLVTPAAACFFAVGAHLAIRGVPIQINERVGVSAIGLWVLLQASGATSLEVDIAKLKTLVGIVGILYLSCVLSEMRVTAAFLQRVSRYSFFIFVAHEPLLTITRKLYLNAVQPEAPWALFLAYFLVAAIVVAVLIFVFKIAERGFPRVLAVMTGGRST